MADDFRAAFEDTKVAPLTDTKPARLVIEGLADEEFWILSLSGNVSPNFQLMYAIGEGAYLNAFNQRLSLFMLKGLHIPASCDQDDDEAEPPFMKFYKEHNIVTAGATAENPGAPVGMSFNNITMLGYVVKLDIKDYSQKGVDGHAFELTFLGKVDGLEGEVTADDPTAEATARGTNTVDTSWAASTSLGGVQFDSVINSAFNQTGARGSSVRAGRPTAPSFSQQAVSVPVQNVELFQSNFGVGG